MFKKLAVVVPAAGLLSVAAPSFAVVDPAVMTAITTGGADAATIGGAILALVIAIAIFRHVRNAK